MDEDYGIMPGPHNFRRIAEAMENDNDNVWVLRKVELIKIPQSPTHPIPTITEDIPQLIYAPKKVRYRWGVIMFIVMFCVFYWLFWTII